jgi:hypothetical protein
VVVGAVICQLAKWHGRHVAAVVGGSCCGTVLVYSWLGALHSHFLHWRLLFFNVVVFWKHSWDVMREGNVAAVAVECRG